MNVLGHALVAGRRRPGDDLHTLGAVLPDLASIAGVRLAATRPVGTALDDGIRCHHAADATFHSLRPFLDGAAALRRDLDAAGIAKGPARAVAHVGFELLLDGAFVGTDVEAAYRAALVHVAGVDARAAIAPAGRPRWRAFAARVAASPPPPLRYDDPAWVARRVHGVLGHRPRLALPDDRVTTVTAILEHHAGAVRAAAPAIVAAFGSLATSAFGPSTVG